MPAIGRYSGAWLYPIFNDRQQSVSIPRWHRHKKSPSRATFDSAENPEFVSLTSPVVCLMTYFGFINFNYYPHSA